MIGKAINKGQNYVTLSLSVVGAVIGLLLLLTSLQVYTDLDFILYFFRFTG